MFISRFIQANYFKKYLAENAVNTISEPLDFKIFWGGCPQTPLQTRASGARFRPPFLEIRSAVPVLVNIETYKPIFFVASSGILCFICFLRSSEISNDNVHSLCQF